LPDQKQIYDLEKLGIGSKVPGSLDWASKEYAGVLVWWSASFFDHVFVPLKSGLPLLHENQVYVMDEKNNTIIYREMVTQSVETFSVKNLLSGKKAKLFQVLVKNQNPLSTIDSVQLSGKMACIFVDGQKTCRSIPDSIFVPTHR
jgi:hypothetical protein